MPTRRCRSRSCSGAVLSPLAALLLSAPAPAVAQQIVSAPGIRFIHEEWTAATGLPVNQLTEMIQSRDGYLWFTTFDGLVRFDGARFVIFNSGNSPDLPANRLASLLEDSHGRLWIQSEQGHLLERSGGRFVDRTADVGGGPVLTLYGDADGVWVGTRTGVYHVTGTSIAGVHTGLVESPVLAILVDSRDALWIGTADGGLYRAGDHGRGPLVRVEALGDDGVHSLAEDPGGDLWIGGSRRIHRLGADGALVTLPAIAGEVGTTFEFHFPQDPSNLWVQAWSGPWVLADGAWIAPEPDRDGRLARAVGTEGPDGGVWVTAGRRVFRNGHLVLSGPGRFERILFDHEGSAWLSGHGLHRLRPAVVEQRGAAAGLVDNVYVIHEGRSGSIWLGTLGSGLVRLDGDVVHRYPTHRSSGLSNIAMAVHEDGRGDVWVALWDGGVCRLDGDRCGAGRIERLGGRRVRGIFEDRDGVLWFGTGDGVFRRDPEDRWFQFGPADGLPHPDVRTFAQDRHGRVWMGTYGGGLALWDGNAFQPIGEPDGLSSPVVRSLYLDPEGVLWVGTEGRGLNRVVTGDPAGPAVESITAYRAADGLFDEGIHQILEDDFGRLWFSTNRGIFWVAKDELTAFAEGRVPRVHSTSYSERDGLLSREMNGGVHGAGIKDRRGHLRFGGIAGVARIDPATIRRNEVPPPVTIEDVTAGAETRPVVGGTMALAARQRDFEIAYTALSFVAPENMRFRYRLDGFNDDWVEAGDRRTAFYTNVPPGEYTFRVVASNNDGVWNEDGATLVLSVAPFFHETWHARGALALLLAALAAGAFRVRERHHRRRAAELEGLVRTRTRTIEGQADQLRALDRAKSRFFANISHELRTPLTLTIGPLEDVRDGLHGALPDGAVEDVELAIRNSHRLLRLVNQILDIARLEAGQMRLRAARGNLADLTSALVRAFAPLAERRRISLRMRAPEHVPELWFDPDLLERVFTNLLSNALKFTPEGGAVLVSIDPVSRSRGAQPDRVRVSVKDSGPGIPESELRHIFERFHRGSEAARRAVPGTGIGLSLARELVKLHVGTIEVESDEGFGTTFSVTLRTGTGHLPPDALLEPDPGSAMPWTPPEPEVDPDAVGEEPGSDAPGPLDATDQPSVLVVDDNADVRAYVRRHLAPRFRVLEAADGAEALSIARADIPDLVVTDVVMPGMDGIALLRALKADPELDFVPVVLLSARAEVEDRVRGIESGADDYLTKPFESAELVARVNNLIRTRKRLRAERPAVELRPSAVDVVSADQRFLDSLRAVIEERMADEDFDVEALAKATAQSRSALYRRLTGLDVGSPADLIRTLRLERAAQLLAGRAGSISEVAYGVGFKSVSHFTRAFRGRFGVTPSVYRDRSAATEASP